MEFNGIKHHHFNPLTYTPESKKEIKIVPRDQRKTSDRLSIYEYTEVISVRARQLENPSSQGFTKFDPSMTPIAKAEKEIKDRRCPLSIRRMLHDNLCEIWDVNEMVPPES